MGGQHGLGAGQHLEHCRLGRDDADALDAEQRALSGALMRVNHVGEVCAQALYQAQALSAKPTNKVNKHVRMLHRPG